VHTQDCVIWLHNCRRDLRASPRGETELGFLAVIDGQALEQEARETRASASTARVESHESLESSAIVCQLTHTIENQVHNFLTNGVVATGEIVGGVFLTGDQLLWVEQLTVSASADLIDHSWLQVHEHATRHVLASTSLGEESVERVITSTDGFVAWHLTIRLDAMLQAEQFPASVSNLDTALANVDADALTHNLRLLFDF